MDKNNNNFSKIIKIILLFTIFSEILILLWITVKYTIEYKKLKKEYIKNEQIQKELKNKIEKIKIEKKKK